MIETQLTTDPLPPLRGGETGGEIGAELVFHGRVREAQDGRRIVALEYEHYPGMAEAELRSLAEETTSRFVIRDLICIHRIGRVPVGHASVRIVVRSRNRADALQAVAWFINELKRRVPIWKWGITVSGERFPAGPRGPADLGPGPGLA